ncbi:hypothetical protein NDU88_001488 [Pleurodeles waltl]|uniref:Uncharacterized protein n=1 Tax=Pleurodeles waltl TaxID=8319 RepID=A0AAV7W0D8_PLEWA|nr:hypothetical protein NDU88_001488 [Pleurodeles waltl]
MGAFRGDVASRRWSGIRYTELPAVAAGPKESCVPNGTKHDLGRRPGVRITRGTRCRGRLKKRKQPAAERSTRVPSRGEQDDGRGSEVEGSSAADAEKHRRGLESRRGLSPPAGIAKMTAPLPPRSESMTRYVYWWGGLALPSGAGPGSLVRGENSRHCPPSALPLILTFWNLEVRQHSTAIAP